MASAVAKKRKEASAIGRRLKEIRTNRGMTQVELGEATGWSQVAISRMEASPKWNPTAETVLKLAAALQCTPNDLLIGGEDLT